MKTSNQKDPKKADRGYATVAVFALVALVVALLIANARTLTALKRELRLIETRQELRLENQSTKEHTNRPAEDVSLP